MLAGVGLVEIDLECVGAWIDGGRQSREVDVFDDLSCLPKGGRPKTHLRLAIVIGDQVSRCIDKPQRNHVVLLHVGQSLPEQGNPQSNGWLGTVGDVAGRIDRPKIQAGWPGVAKEEELFAENAINSFVYLWRWPGRRQVLRVDGAEIGGTQELLAG